MLAPGNIITPSVVSPVGVQEQQHTASILSKPCMQCGPPKATGTSPRRGSSGVSPFGRRDPRRCKDNKFSI